MIGVFNRALLASLLLIGPAGHAQAAESSDIGARIRKEEQAHSRIMRSVHMLADVYGPRLTGSPNEKAAGEWAVAQMASWELRNGHMEPWNFGHDGWVNERASGYVVSPIHDQLTFKVVAWTPSTNGVLTAQAMLIAPPEAPTKERLAHYLATVKGTVRGKIVMIGSGAPVVADPDPAPYRFDDRTVAKILTPQPAQPPPEPADDPELSRTQIDRQIDAFLLSMGAVMRINDARSPQGLIRAYSNDTYDPTKALPTVVMRNEDYGRIARIAADGGPVTLAFDIRNRLYPEGRTAYDTLADIPGGDKADEVVMLGAHLDSWHSATGATDDAIGCAIMMEAARILHALGIHPRRTIRVVLWTGEEQYLLGSQAYVAEHFGTAENPGPEFAKLAAYLNIDGGTGRIRGANVFGPPESAAILRAALSPFADLGVAGAVPHRFRRLGSTDATTFSRAGLPAVGLFQDPIENGIAWHSNLDTYDRVVEAEAKDAAVVVAALAYDLATRGEMLPRFTPAQMPAFEGAPPVARPVAAAAGGSRRPPARSRKREGKPGVL